MRNILFSPLINAYYIDGDMIVFGTTRGFIVMDSEYDVLNEFYYKKMLGEHYDR